MPFPGYRINQTRGILLGCTILGILLCHVPCQAQSKFSSLWLSPAPPTDRPTGTSSSHEYQGPAASPTQGRPENGRDIPTLENEHFPKPMRSYLLHNRHGHGDIKAVLRRPSGTVEPASVQENIVSFKAPMGDSPAHGANNLYVVEKWLESDTLVIRVAERITMHHSCGWGHDHKFDDQRINPQALSDIPLEIIPAKLWDSNFHSSLHAGDTLQIKILSKGRPAMNAKLMVRTGKNWQREFIANEKGMVSFQLINDYTPTAWPNFKRTKRMPLMLTASYGTPESGVYQEQPYKSVAYTTTLPWHYQPALAQYSSYGYGLLIGIFSMLLTGMGIYVHRRKRRYPGALREIGEK